MPPEAPETEIKMPLKMKAAELMEFVDREFPQATGDFRVEELSEGRISVRMFVGNRHVRPGGTVSGPTMFALADVSVYLAILSMIGPVGMAVTTSASIDFMRKPEADADLVSECRLLKLGRALAVGDVLIRSVGSENVVARASLTYSIPPNREGGA